MNLNIWSSCNMIHSDIILLSLNLLNNLQSFCTVSAILGFFKEIYVLCIIRSSMNTNSNLSVHTYHCSLLIALHIQEIPGLEVNFSGFLSTYRQIPRRCLKTVHDHFLNDQSLSHLMLKLKQSRKHN
jgi:hypothetical protein